MIFFYAFLFALAFPLGVFGSTVPGVPVFGQYSAIDGGFELDAQAPNVPGVTNRHNGDGTYFSPILLATPAPVSSTYRDINGSSTVAASAFGSVVGGLVREQVNTTIQNSGVCVDIAGVGCGSAFSDLILGWFDTFRLAGPPGKLLTYQLELHDTYQDFTANQRSDAESRVSVAVTSLSDGSLQAQALARRSLFGGLEMDTFSNIATVVGVSGSEFAISNTSLAQCTANPDPGMASSQCDVNFSDTSYFTLDPVTPGASYLTGSGVDYRASAFPAAQQTPEPCSAVLFGFGFFAFFLRRTISVKNTVD